MSEYDVVVVGSGPGGSSCAKTLMDAGISVLVVEKETLPRYKTCSGVLFGESQELIRAIFGSDPPEAVHCTQDPLMDADDIREWDEQRGCYIPYVWELDKDGRSFSRTYRNIWRDRFDHWLLKQSGAEVRDGTRVQSYAVEGERVVVAVQPATKSGPSGPDSVRCKYLVGADGNPSVVRRQLTPPPEGGLAGRRRLPELFPLRLPG